MNNQTKELLKTLLQEREYISCTIENQKEVMEAIKDTGAKVIYILLDEIHQKVYLSLRREYFKGVKGEVLELLQGYRGRWCPLFFK